jgi:hypothetical protein
MIKLLVNIWKDPVFSKVIAAAICGFFIWLWSYFDASSFNNVIKNPITVPQYIVITPWIFIIVQAVLKFNTFLKAKPKISGRDDIISILNLWWSKSENNPHQDVHVDFSYLEKMYNLAEGTVSEIIEEVAERRGFKVVSHGENYATFTYVILSGFSV